MDIYKLASELNIKHTIKGDKTYTDKIQDGAQIAALLRAYNAKHGHEEFIHTLISSYSDILGGIAFNNAKIQLSNHVNSL